MKPIANKPHAWKVLGSLSVIVLVNVAFRREIYGRAFRKAAQATTKKDTSLYLRQPARKLNPMNLKQYTAQSVTSNENEKLSNNQTWREATSADQIENIQHQDEGGIRYLTFGASITWGAGMVDRFQAYPFLLSPNVANHAILASGPVYPSLCAESLVGDDGLYDVIILEYHMPILGLSQLAKRLRQRFPDAIIIFYRYWYPYQIFNPDTNENVVAWAEKNGHGELHSESFKHAFLDSDINWQWRDVKYTFWVQAKAASEVGGHILPLTKPDDPRDFVKYSHWISPDWLHLSEIGHAFVAKRVREIVESVGVVSAPRLGTWGDGDSCVSWYESGDCPLAHSDNIQMEMFGIEDGNYALKIPSEGGTVTVHNPSDQPLELYLGYMTTAPFPSKYPNTEVTIRSRASSRKLDSLTPSSFGDNMHASVTKSVGMIDPGENVLFLKPMEETEYPFRLIAVSVTGKYEHRWITDKYVTDPQFRGDTVVSRGE